MPSKKLPKRKPKKFSGSAKVTLTAVSLLGFVGGWNVIARLESQKAESNPPLDDPATAQVNILPVSTATPWPTIAPLVDIPPIPTLNPSLTTMKEDLQPVVAGNVTYRGAPTSVSLKPLPTFAPLPPMPTIPAPAPLPQTMPGNEWQQSGAS